MVTDELIQYIKSQKNAGTSQKDIFARLLSQGWSQSDIQSGFSQAESNQITSPTPSIDTNNSAQQLEEKPKKIIPILSVSIVILIIIVGFFINTIIINDFATSTRCFTDATTAADVTYQKAKTMKPGNERDHFICTQDETDFQNLVRCLEQSKQKNAISFYFYSKLPQFINTFQSIIASHNLACPDTPLSIPQF